jgi:alginate O-acetyltransferase complex protein AlgJ
MHATGAGLPDQMSYEFGFPMDVVAVMGSGATPARRSLARRKDNLSGKKLVVWCFSSREFTQGQGWELVKVIKDNTTPPMPQTQP